jgi:hypothetical protein
MTTSPRKSIGVPRLRSGPMITGSTLVAVGGLIALAGVAVGGWHVLSAIQQWVREMEVPPSELAKIKWSQAKSAAAAGTAAWQNGVPAGQGART